MADTSWMARVGARLVTNGYAILPIAPGTKKPGQFARAAWHDYPQWNRHASRATTELEVATWSSWPGCGVGIVGGAVAALDIDIAEDGELALRIERLARERLGDTPALRIGKPPKRLLVYRAAEPFAGIRRAPLEMLCLGQQFVAYAEHPDTGQPYAWPDEGLADLDIESLPEIDAEQAAAFLDEALALIPPELRPKSLGAKGENGAGHPCLPAHAQAGTLAAIRSALAWLPNAELDYDSWMRIGMALKGALGEEGAALFADWSAQAAKNDPAATAKAWTSFKPARIGAGTIYHLAMEKGWRPDPDLLLDGSQKISASDEHPAAGLLARLAQPEAPMPIIPPEPSFTLTIPGGLVGDLARYMIDTARRPQPPITDGAAGKPRVFRYKDLRAWWSNAHYNRPGGVESGTPTAWVPQSKPIWFTELGCPAIDRGTNQPNVFFDPKSSESFTPHFSRGWRDDAIQRAYLEATYLWWGDAANNPESSVYGGRMVHVPECAAWTWDARPYPFFPALTDVWTDGANWRLGHWLTGRLGAVSLAALVRHLCLRAGLPEARIDVSGLWGAVEGYAITALESPRASITTLSRHFGFDAVETEGVIRFVMRGRASVATLAPDDLVATREGDVLELTRGQETELPQALKWQIARADEDYDAALVEARRITVDTTRIASESFPMAVPPEEAERRCRRALMEAWVGRETAAFRLPPSRLALDPADAIRLEHDGRLVDLRLVSIADAEARGIEAVRQDRATYDLPPGDPRAASLTRAVVFGAPDAVLMDLPQLTEDQPAHRPLVAAHAVPWPGEMAVFRSPSTDGFELLKTFGGRARIGTLVSDFFAGPTSRFDLGNALVIDLLTGTLESVTDLTLFGGANALAIESAPGDWEIVQAGAAELLAPGRYRLTRLLRGQRGTEGAMGNPAPAGARVVVLDTALASLPIAEADLGIPWNWRIGPASRPVSDETFVAQAFTPEGVGLRPFSVVHVQQPWRTPRTPGDFTIRWTHRSRALAADSWGAVDAPLAEELEAYEVEILDGATVKRVLSTATTNAVYTTSVSIAPNRRIGSPRGLAARQAFGGL